MSWTQTPAVFMYAATALAALAAAIDLASGDMSGAARSGMLSASMVILAVTNGRPQFPWTVVFWALITATLVMAIVTWTSR